MGFRIVYLRDIFYVLKVSTIFGNLGLVVIWVIWFNPCHAQLFSEYNFKFKSYTVKNGIAHDKVNKVVQDSKGFLWVGTEGGLSRFDGYKFKNFKNIETDSTTIPFNNILDMTIDNNDVLWLAFGHSFCSYNPSTGVFKEYKFDDQNIACERIIYHSKQDVVYFASRSQGLYKMDMKNKLVDTTILSKPLLHNVTSLSFDSKSFLWISIERHGYYTYQTEQNTFTYLDVKEWPMFIHEDPKRKQYYTGTWLGEFMIFDGLRLPKMSDRHVMSKFEGYEKCTYNDCSFAPKITGDSILWVTSQMGLGLYNVNQNKFVKYNYYDASNLDGITSNYLGDIYVSRDGSVWISSWHGLQQVNPQAQSFSKTYLPELDINIYNLVSGIADDPIDKNKLWMTVNGTGLAEWNKKTSKIEKFHFKQFLKPIDTNYDKRWTQRIHKDKNDVLWIGTYGGFIRIKNKKVLHFNTYVDNKPIYAYDSYQDRNKTLWLLGQYLIHFNPYDLQYKYFTINDPINGTSKNTTFICMADGKDNNAFVGTTNGLYILNKNTNSFKNLTIQYHNKDNHAINNIRALSYIEDKLYFGTHIGLFQYNLTSGDIQKVLGSFIENKGLTTDNSGALWAFTTDGLFKINTKNNTFIKFDQNDGLFTSSTDPVTFFEYNNKMHIGHRSLFTSFDPWTIGKNITKPLPFITEINSQGRECIPNGDQLILAYDNADISFDFTAIEYAVPAKLEFSYMLDGFDHNWSEYSLHRTKSYTNLPHGTYTFKVKAKNLNGVESETPDMYTFVVKPAFWQTWWFQMLVIMLLIGSIVTWYRFRIDQIRKREAEKTIVNKKMAELDEKLLRSQMNPHFIFNSLNSIQKFIWESKEEMAAEYVASFAKLMRGILENSRKEFTTLSEEYEMLQLYIELEHRRSNGRFDYHINIDPNLETDKIKILPLILQPFIENAIWHGLNKKENGGKLLVSIMKKDDHNMQVTIEDNGVGRSKEVIQQHGKSSLGQSITSQRLHKLMEVTKKNTDVEIIDLTDVSGKASGTKVIITLPIIY